MLPFIIVGAVGLAVVLLSLFVGELFDLLDGAISATGLGSAFTVFGAAGAISTANGLPGWAAYVIAIGVGILVLVGVQLLIRSFRRSEDGAPSSPLGLYGTARTSISTSSGEVSLDGPGEIETRLAFADARIETGTRIRVVEMQGSRVKVEPADAASSSVSAAPEPTTDPTT
ncbi:NfeD family protein [Homoserinibacter sp. YIM 151385]|uniref:NfeD family protein n=1 Tax=Homoserinibacter sp. YIM 151385 TaxID=2985506 RepID=UPI0022F032F2|nr:NfeD family protein [Homoserinibacter sp. YIM 151385]WBU39057.1 NfeD family protein [Homoserinibacter sp. YIM 151385]